MAKPSTALCFLFMVVMAYTVQQSEGTIILKSLALIHLLKKLKAKKAAVVTAPVVAPTVVVEKKLPPPVYHKPVYAKVTAGVRPDGYKPPTGYDSSSGRYGDGGRRLMA